MKIVLDTNVLFNAISRKSKYYPIWTAIRTNQISLLLSHDIMLEYEEILGSNFSPELAEFVLNTVKKAFGTIYIDNYFNWNLISSDPDDNKFVDTAFNGGAAYLITEDKHFNVLSKVEFPKIQVISPKKFLKILAGLP
jgi:uncharacterized protein